MNCSGYNTYSTTNFVILALILFSLTSCDSNEKAIVAPFDVNHQLECEDLIEQGYRLMFGVDVILLGKRTGDTLEYYQLDDKPNTPGSTYTEFDESEADPTLNNYDSTLYEILKSKDPLLLTDSEYKMIYFDLSKYKEPFCKDMLPVWRRFELTIREEDTATYHKVDDTFFEVFERKKPENHNYNLRTFSVINRNTKDTFNCHIYEEYGKFFFATSIDLYK